jgi:hypothetical protein
MYLCMNENGWRRLGGAAAAGGEEIDARGERIRPWAWARRRAVCLLLKKRNDENCEKIVE